MKLNQYLSQDEDEEVEATDKHNKQHHTHTWCHKRTFETATEATDRVDNERIWSPTTPYDTVLDENSYIDVIK